MRLQSVFMTNRIDETVRSVGFYAAPKFAFRFTANKTAFFADTALLHKGLEHFLDLFSAFQDLSSLGFNSF